MNKILSVFLSLTLISSHSFADEKQPDRSRITNPDRDGNDRGYDGRGGLGDRGDYSPDNTGDRSGSYDGGSSSYPDGGYSDGPMFNEGKFLAVRNAMISAPEDVRQDIQESYNSQLVEAVKIGAVAAAIGWAISRWGLKRVTGVLSLAYASTVAAGTWESVVEREGPLVLFSEKVWESAAVEIAFEPLYAGGVEKIIDIAEEKLCAIPANQQTPQIKNLCL